LAFAADTRLKDTTAAEISFFIGIPLSVLKINEL